MPDNKPSTPPTPRMRDQLTTLGEWATWLYRFDWMGDPATQYSLFALRAFLPPAKALHGTMWGSLDYATNAEHERRSILITILFGLGLAAFFFIMQVWDAKQGDLTKDASIYARMIHVFASIPWGVIAPMVTAPSIVLLWIWRHQHKRKDIKQAKKNHRLDMKRVDSDAFNTALDNLGNPSETIRIGGLYILERLALQNVDLYPQCTETICGFYRSRDAEEKAKAAPTSADASTSPDKKTTYNRPIDMDTTLHVLQRLCEHYYKESLSFCPLNLSQTDLSHVTHFGLGVALYHAQLYKADLRHAMLSGSNLQSAKIAFSDLSDAVLGDSDIRNTSFNYSTLRNTTLNRTKADDADFRYAILDHVSFRDAEAKRARLDKAKVTFADFSKTKLNQADMPCATLDHVNFMDAELIGANFRFAIMANIDLRSTNLSDASFLETKITKMRYNSKTIFPEGFTPPSDSIPC